MAPLRASGMKRLRPVIPRRSSVCELRSSCDVHQRRGLVSDECFEIPHWLIAPLLSVHETSKFAVSLDGLNRNKKSYVRHSSIAMIAEFYRYASAVLYSSTEPPLQSRCNLKGETWSGRPDSNRGLPAPKAGALPGCATPRHQVKI